MHNLQKKSLELLVNQPKFSVSKAQLTAFFVKVEADPSLKLRVDAAGDGSAVVAIAEAEGFHFSPASLARHLRA